MNTYWILCNVPHSSYFVFPNHATYMLNFKSQVSKQTRHMYTWSFSLFRLFMFTRTFTGPFLCGFLPYVTALFYFKGTCRLYKSQWQLMFLSVWSEWVTFYLGQNKSLFFMYIYGVIQCKPRTCSGWIYKQRYHSQPHK